MAFRICQVVHLKPLKLLFDVGVVHEQRGDHDQGSKFLRHALGEV